MSDLLLSVQEAAIAFNGKPIFEDLTFHIKDGERISLVGRNGAGKSTLMNIITEKIKIDSGEHWKLAGIKVGYLEQDVIPQTGQTVFEYVFDGIEAETEEEKTLYEYRVDMVCEPLHLDKNAEMTVLSGGQLRRAALARALVHEPEILLLDEPTNHLDLDVIEWLEEFLKGWRGALLIVSHDKKFLENVSNRVFWLDRGKIRICPRGFAHFEEWSAELLEQERRELHNRAKFVEVESEWANRGVKARVKRNVARVARVREMREQLKKDQSSFRRVTRKIELPQISTEVSSKVICEFKQVCKSYDDKEKVIDSFVSVLSGETPEYHFKGNDANDPIVVNSGTVEAILNGGNHILISHIVGTDYLSDFKNKLFFTESNQPLFSDVDMVLHQFRLSGLLDNVQGFILGKMIGHHYRVDYLSHIRLNMSFEEIARKHFPNIPVVTNFPCGHEGCILTFPLDILFRLKAYESGEVTLTQMEAATQ